MQISRYKAVVLNYVAKDAQGEVLDSSDIDGPIRYIHGTEDLIPGLESALEGHTTGEQLQVEVPMHQAYGERDEALVEDVPRENFPGIDEITTGMKFQTEMEDGTPFIVTVTGVNSDFVSVDGNHPFAGKDLYFDLEIVEVREASAEEIEQGHVHHHEPGHPVH